MHPTTNPPPPDITAVLLDAQRKIHTLLSAGSSTPRRLILEAKHDLDQAEVLYVKHQHRQN